MAGLAAQVGGLGQVGDDVRGAQAAVLVGGEDVVAGGVEAQDQAAVHVGRALDAQACALDEGGEHPGLVVDEGQRVLHDGARVELPVGAGERSHLAVPALDLDRVDRVGRHDDDVVLEAVTGARVGERGVGDDGVGPVRQVTDQAGDDLPLGGVDRPPAELDELGQG